MPSTRNTQCHICIDAARHHCELGCICSRAYTYTYTICLCHQCTFQPTTKPWLIIWFALCMLEATCLLNSSNYGVSVCLHGKFHTAPIFFYAGNTAQPEAGSRIDSQNGGARRPVHELRWMIPPKSYKIECRRYQKCLYSRVFALESIDLQSSVSNKFWLPPICDGMLFIWELRCWICQQKTNSRPARPFRWNRS